MEHSLGSEARIALGSSGLGMSLVYLPHFYLQAVWGTARRAGVLGIVSGLLKDPSGVLEISIAPLMTGDKFFPPNLPS